VPRIAPGPFLVVEAALILLADFVDARWGIACLVVAMGIQNPVATRCGVPLNTTFITGVILRFCEGLARFLRPHPHGKAEPFMIYGLVWLGYVSGAALGTGVYGFGFAWPSLVPLVLLAGIYVPVRHIR